MAGPTVERLDTTGRSTERSDVTLILGGARSGKSAHGEARAERRSGALVYLATAEARDGEMELRIAAHRARRGPRWTTVEEPLELDGALMRAASPDGAVLVDCLTLWLANLIEAGRDVEAEGSALAATLATLPGAVILVSNEVGLGIVPDNAAAREFRDHAGRLHQGIAAAAGRVLFMAAGLPLTLKG